MKLTSLVTAPAIALMTWGGREHTLLGVAGVILAGCFGLALLIVAVQGRINITIGVGPHQPP